MAHQVSVTLLGPGLLDPGDAADLLDGIVPGWINGSHRRPRVCLPHPKPPVCSIWRAGAAARGSVVFTPHDDCFRVTVGGPGLGGSGSGDVQAGLVTAEVSAPEARLLVAE